MRPQLIKYNYLPKRLLNGKNLSFYINIICFSLIIILLIYLTYRYHNKDEYKKQKLENKKENMKKIAELLNV